MAAGVYKLPDLPGPAGEGVRPQARAASMVAAGRRLPVRWFETRTLWPFGVYCILAGAASLPLAT
jgi:undecaprenyl-diphosphatase